MQPSSKLEQLLHSVKTPGFLVVYLHRSDKNLHPGQLAVLDMMSFLSTGAMTPQHSQKMKTQVWSSSLKWGLMMIQ